MDWNIILYETNRKEKPVEDFIKSLDPSTIAKTSHNFDLLQKHGPILGMPHSKKLTTDLYELRIRGKQEIRILYSFINRNIYLLHVFKKKRQKIAKKEIDIASERRSLLTRI